MLFQQNLAQSLIAVVVVVIVAHSIKLEELLPLFPLVLKAIEEMRPGEIRRVGAA
jgi:hypothetical protein